MTDNSFGPLFQGLRGTSLEYTTTYLLERVLLKGTELLNSYHLTRNFDLPIPVPRMTTAKVR